MSVKIRLSRGGSKKRPYYKIVAADSRAPRDGKFIEKLGTFNPLLPKDHKERLNFDQDKVKAWIKKGAQPSERLQKIFSEFGICKAPSYAAQTKQTQPKAKALARIEEKKAKAEAAAEAAREAKEAAKAAKEAAAAAPAAEEAKTEE